ncbi:hypothetical protein ABZ671_18480 [Micromonospora sp. NPDC006766]|uniref:hypothetical protein n=1 Tax=Micromonospora sp. NPDC006766 TaxID=3154778 RepID=UPI0033FB8807
MSGDPWTDLRFWQQVITDARRTVLVEHGRAAEVTAMLDRHGVAGQYDVHESGAVPAGQILVVDHHAVDAIDRQSAQAITGRILRRDANPSGAVQREDGHGTG